MEFIHEAGWPIYPVLLLGVITLWSAIGHAREPRWERLTLTIGFGVATLAMGVLGTALGYDASVRHIGELPDSERWIVLIGLREALNNLSVALLFVIASAVSATIGSYRMLKAPIGELHPVAR